MLPMLSGQLFFEGYSQQEWILRKKNISFISQNFEISDTVFQSQLGTNHILVLTTMSEMNSPTIYWRHKSDKCVVFLFAV